MNHTRSKFLSRGMNIEEYQRYYHRYQQEYLRVKLLCIKTFAEGKEIKDVATIIGKSEASCRTYLARYIESGFKGLCQRDKRKQPERLTPEQLAAFKTVLLTRRPAEEGLEGNIWTGEHMRQFLLARYGVSYKSGIYDLLERLGLSHQRAHADYGNASREDQALFLEDFRHTLNAADDKSAVVCFDEFSIGAIPTPHYGWAEKNTRPTVVTDEKKEPEPTACWE
jgi:transposase